MTRSADVLRDLHTSKDEVKIGHGILVGDEGYVSLTVTSPNEAGGITVRLENVPYVLDLAFNYFSLMAAHPREVDIATDDEDMSVTLVDGRLRFWCDESGYSNYGRKIDPDDNYIPSPEPIKNLVQPDFPVPLGFPVIALGSDDSTENDWLNSLTLLPKNLVKSAHPAPLAFPMIAPGGSDSREAAVDINVFYFIHGHTNEFMLRETA